MRDGRRHITAAKGRNAAVRGSSRPGQHGWTGNDVCFPIAPLLAAYDWHDPDRHSSKVKTSGLRRLTWMESPRRRSCASWDDLRHGHHHGHHHLGPGNHPGRAASSRSCNPAYLKTSVPSPPDSVVSPSPYFDDFRDNGGAVQEFFRPQEAAADSTPGSSTVFVPSLLMLNASTTTSWWYCPRSRESISNYQDPAYLVFFPPVARLYLFLFGNFPHPSGRHHTQSPSLP